MPTVAALNVYPIKSCRGLPLKAVRFDLLGPLYDRRFMLVDEAGKFLTQRELPRMALIEPRLGPTSLQISAPGMPQLKVAMAHRDSKRIEVAVWGYEGAAEHAGEHAADWFSSFLERSVQLVHFPEDVRRKVSQRHTELDAQVGFADAYPVLLLSEASLADLNGRMKSPLPMDRFRPNLVVKDCDAFAEDRWKRIRIGDLTLDVVKPCSRCAITTVDQITGQRGTEPLTTLATYRKHENDVWFGQNCVHHGPGSVRVGDQVEVLETAPE
jgi:uncharacterized protein YcbX